VQGLDALFFPHPTIFRSLTSADNNITYDIIRVKRKNKGGGSGLDRDGLTPHPSSILRGQLPICFDNKPKRLLEICPRLVQSSSLGVDPGDLLYICHVPLITLFKNRGKFPLHLFSPLLSY